MTTFNTILIDPAARTVSALPFDTDGDELAQLYAAIGCTMVELVMLDNGDSLWTDEEGLLCNPQHFFHLPTLFPAQPIAGRALITGTEYTDDGAVSSVPIHTTVESVLADVKWYTLPELQYALASGAISTAF